MQAGTALELAQSGVQQAVDHLAAMEQLPRNKAQEVPDVLVGLDGIQNRLVQLLQSPSDKCKLLLLHGMTGIGKTTVAKLVFNELHAQAPTMPCHFLRMDPRVKNDEYIVQQQRELLYELARVDGKGVGSTAQGKAVLAQKLDKRKVLLVVDNVGASQLLSLLPMDIMDVLGEGSVVLFTSQDSGVAHGLGGRLLVETMAPLSSKLSLELLCMHAYRNNRAPADEEDEINLVVARCGGMPMALEVVGIHLKRSNRRQFFDHIEGALSSVFLNQRAGRLEKQRTVFGALQSSWDALGDNSEDQETLLDIVWFLRDQEWSLVSSFCKEGVLERLCSLSLVSLVVDSNSKLVVKVHEVIADFCKMVVGSNQRLELNTDDVGDEPISDELAMVNQFARFCAC
jgi:hypothetical protein